MSEKTPRNIARSIRDRLKNLSKERKEDFNYVILHYASERFLYRLSQSSYRDNFVLKGATLCKISIGFGVPDKIGLNPSSRLHNIDTRSHSHRTHHLYRTNHARM